MFFFLLGGIWNAIMCIITFFQLFDENTIELALATLPDYLVMVAACFSIFSLLLKIKTLEGNIDSLANKVMTCELKIKDLEKSKNDK